MKDETMTPVISMPDPKAIEAEACAWVAQVDGGKMSSGDRAALKEWISRSPQHKRSFERMAARFMQLHDPLSASDMPAKQRRPLKNLFNWVFTQPPGITVTMAALVAFFLSIGLPVVEKDAPAPWGQRAVVASYYSELGEQKTVVLEDGSKLVLNTNTRVDISMDTHERMIHLIYGEAIFDVEKDPARPFKVYTQKGVVKAIGTVFSVRVRPSDVEVVVEEGIVELSPKTAAKGLVGENPSTTKLSSGKFATFNETQQIVTSVDMKTMDKKLSWRDGVLVFEFDPLSYVVEEVSRYTDVKIVISDPKILNIPVGGNFRVGETKALLDALEKGLGLKVTRVKDDLVYLSPRA